MSRPERSPELIKRQRCGFNLRTVTRNDEFKVKDEIHSDIVLPPVAGIFIQTPQFQRLRDILQLGVTFRVFEKANHNRYEHSIGVAHLARFMCQSIAEAQPLLNCTSKDRLCVLLAGLLHDLGHGIFSHIYEQFLERMHSLLKKSARLRAKYKNFPAVPDQWAHETASLMMIDAALESLGLEIDLKNLDQPLKQIGDGIDAKSMRVFDETDSVLTSRDLCFVKEMIFGGPLPGHSKLMGRPEWNEEWLYQIVSNALSGADVDKMDYYARDSKKTLRGVRDPPIDLPMMSNARVAWGECGKSGSKNLMIVYPQSMHGNACKFFQRRFELHDEAYQEKTSAAVSIMMTDILCLADIHLTLILKDGSRLPMSRAMTSPEAYLKLCDSFVAQMENFSIDNSNGSSLVEAKKLYERYQKGDFYTFAGEYVVNANDSVDAEMWEMEENDLIEEMLQLQVPSFGGGLQETDVAVGKFSIHHGKRDRDPVAAMRFITEQEMDSLRQIEVEHLPTAKPCSHRTRESFHKKGIRFFSRCAKKAPAVEDLFKKWIKERKSVPTYSPCEDLRIVSQEEADGESEWSHGNVVSQEDELGEDRHACNDWMLQSTEC
mmetsp:Transcript_1103/g.2367  ORF Transcript_1103/g.2367 Transcript_1103/m.2367 type:complete len:602 (+) Transcript_1103:131-1936(+)